MLVSALSSCHISTNSLSSLSLSLPLRFLSVSLACFSSTSTWLGSWGVSLVSSTHVAVDCAFCLVLVGQERVRTCSDQIQRPCRGRARQIWDNGLPCHATCRGLRFFYLLVCGSEFCELQRESEILLYEQREQGRRVPQFGPFSPRRVRLFACMSVWAQYLNKREKSSLSFVGVQRFSSMRYFVAACALKGIVLVFFWSLTCILRRNRSLV